AGKATRSEGIEVETRPRDERPRLVIAVVFDQLAGYTLDRYESALDANGAIRTASERGVNARVRYPYSSTVTACGHTAIFTGVTPSENGVVTNEVYDRARGSISVFDDGEHAVIGAPGTFASPEVIRVATVADALDRATNGAARIVSVSLKDRGAIPGGGRHADAVLWYDKESGRFTTSSAYAEALPAWLVEWATANPLEASLTTWVPSDPALLARVAGTDERPGEGDYLGLGAAFPHELAASAAPRSAIRVAPQGTERLLSLAEAAVNAYQLGEDEVPDLLAISISGTDYAGHVYGPSSWEYVDHLIRADRALGALLARLEARTSIAVLITSDHGVAPLPEETRDSGRSGRIRDAEVIDVLEAAIDAALGPGDWVDAFVEPYVYLSSAAELAANRDRASRA
ncbi:MAG: alkaline phosphatase family protein, partial [Polyangiaceae bacterium]|nr:alkaline phosphatase family protein [Polyangiaceae bacterium]